MEKLNGALEVSSNNLVALMLAGIVHQQRGDVEKARQVYEKALESNPNFAAAANNLAYIHSEDLGDDVKALEYAQRAKELAPENPSISDTLGWILYKRGIYERALNLIQESAVQIPDNTEILYHLGMVHFRMRNEEAALEALSRALELSSSFKGAVEARHTLMELRRS